MPRTRFVRPELWIDERFVACSVTARLLYLGGLNFADSDGRLPPSPKWLRMKILPADSVEPTSLVDELIEAGLWEEHTDHYLVVDFDDTQPDEKLNDLKNRIRAEARTTFYGDLVDRDGERCATCGTSGVDLEVDHIVPLAQSLDDPNRLSNLQLLCGPCNRRKGAS